jgi:hypothetical protein
MFKSGFTFLCARHAKEKKIGTKSLLVFLRYVRIILFVRSFVRLQMTKLHGQPEGLYWSFSKNVIMITSDKTSHPSSGQNAEVITPEMSKNIHPVY